MVRQAFFLSIPSIFNVLKYLERKGGLRPIRGPENVEQAPVQTASFIRIALDSLQLACRPKKIQSFQSCLQQFQVGHVVTFRTCMRMTGLVASAIAFIRMARLHMRPFQVWMTSLGIPSHCHYRKVRVTQEAVTMLNQWREEVFFSRQGYPWV